MKYDPKVSAKANRYVGNQTVKAEPVQVEANLEYKETLPIPKRCRETDLKRVTLFQVSRLKGVGSSVKCSEKDPKQIKG